MMSSPNIAISAHDAYVAFDERSFRFSRGQSATSRRGSVIDGVKQASMPSSIFNLSNTILGASTLAIAFACRELGVAVFVPLLIVFGLLANFSIQLLTRSLVFSDRETYGDIGYEAMGRFGEMLALCCVVVQQLGACIAYVDVIGDVLDPIVANIDHPIFDGRVFWQIATVVIVIFPLCMLKKMDSLKFSSLVAVFLIFIFAVVVTIDGVASANKDDLFTEFSTKAIRMFPDDALGALRVVPVVCFAFVCHMNVFPIYQELKDRSIGRMDTVGSFAVLICFVVYAMAGIMGYVGFKDEVCDDLLDTYNESQVIENSLVPGVVVHIVQIGIGIALIFSFPVLAFELRHCVDALLFPHSSFSWARHTIENILIIVIALAVGILVPVVVTVFGFIGATTSTLIVFVMPPMFYLKIENANRTNEVVAAHNGGCGRWLRRTIAWAELIMGILLIPTCLTALTMQQVDGSTVSCKPPSS